ncbi:Hsp70 family protein [Singulisphaera sp. Ch08]|uniref:Hsp70 family protein n=1 Tax=Singulisphaera sp. Ch08 TaxID=3120278 RepID=A0AAU7CJ61_9BACT
MPNAFGIDFGTTNTRVAYCDGEQVKMVPFHSREHGNTYQIPTAIAYHRGTPVATGFEALMPPRGSLFPEPLKWILGQEEPVEADGESRDRVDIVADFLLRLRERVADSLPNAPLERAAVTIPVHYPPRAREQLDRAFRKAGIEVSHFFFEPIAAIYAGLIGEPASGVTAVFDWGGGSLDIATVQIRDGIALTRQIDGWHRGGSHFDRLVAQQTVNDFLARNPSIEGFPTDTILDRMKVGRDLRLRVEAAKIQLSRHPEASVTFLTFLQGANINYRLRRDEFDELIAPDVRSAIARLERALRASGVTHTTLARLFLSGGTCNIPAIKNRLATDIAGHKLVGSLRLPARMKDSHALGGLDDIGNATAVGAALLAVHGSEPVFASAIGVRLSGEQESFHPIFREGERLDFRPKMERFFVTDARAGVARLLVCDQDDPVIQPSGRLLRVITVPIETDENWIEARFTLDRHLALKVDAAGQQNIKRDTFGRISSWPSEPAWVQSLNLGFRIPDFTIERVLTR